MAEEDTDRYFTYREQNGDEVEEDGVYTGDTPRDAALKVARRKTDPRDSVERAEEEAREIRIRERGTEKVHVYEAWSWTRETDDNDPDWLGDEVTEANVSKKGIDQA